MASGHIESLTFEGGSNVRLQTPNKDVDVLVAVTDSTPAGIVSLCCKKGDKFCNIALVVDEHGPRLEATEFNGTAWSLRLSPESDRPVLAYWPGGQTENRDSKEID